MSVNVDKAVTARLSIGSKKFEILVDPNKALEFKKGASISMSDILAYPVVYKDAKTTEEVAAADLQGAFGTTDAYKIAEKIIKQGEMQVTTEQRRQMVEQKRTQIAAIIARQAVNPQNNLPHPPQRILNAMDQAGVNVDPFADANVQVDKILKVIKPILPIKFQKIVLQLKITPQFAGKAYPVLKTAGNMQQEQWLNDGSLQVNLEIMAGVQDELTQKLANLTHGQYEVKVLKREDV